MPAPVSWRASMKSYLASNRIGDWDWGYVASVEDLLLGSSVKQAAAWNVFWGGKAWYDGTEGDVTHPVCSDQLFAQYKDSGQLRWTYQEGVILNTTVTVSNDRVMFVESRSRDLVAADQRRLAADELWEQAYLVALDLHSGERLWQQPLQTKPGKVAGYLASDGQRIALVSSNDGQYHVDAFAADTGQPLWNTVVPWGQGQSGPRFHTSRGRRLSGNGSSYGQPYWISRRARSSSN